MADRDITLSIDLDVKDAEKTSKELQEKVQDIFKSQKSTDSPAMTALNNRMKQLVVQAREAQTELQRIGSTQIKTEAFTELERKFQNLEKYSESLKRKAADFLRKGGAEDSPIYEELFGKFTKADRGLAILEDRMERMKQDGTAFISGADTKEYDEQLKKLDSINDKLKQQLVKHNQIGKQVKKNSKGFNGFKGGFTKILGYLVGIRSLFALVGKLRSAIKEGFENLVANNDTFKKQVDGLKGSLLTLKNTLASAFEPIVSVAIPYIQKLVDWLTMLIDKVAQFSAAITGQKKYTKAVKQTADAIANAKKQAEGSLGSFDKLNNITTGNDKQGMFEEVSIDSKVLDTVNKLKEGLKEVATFVGTNFKTGFEATFNTDKAKESIQTIKDDFIGLKNAFVEIANDPQVQEATTHLVGSMSTSFGEVSGAVTEAAVTLGRDAVRIVTEPVIKIKDTIAQVIANVFESTAQMLDVLNQKFAKAWKIVTDAYDKYIKPTVDNVIDVLSGAYEWILTTFAKLWDWLTDTIADVGGTILDEIGPVVEQIFALIKEVGDAITQLWKTVLIPILNWIRDYIWPVIKKVLDVVVSAVKNGVKIISNTVQMLLNFVRTVIGSIVDLLTGKPKQALERFKGFFSDAFGNIKNIIQSFWNFLKDFVDGFFGMFEKVGEALGSAFSGIKNFFTGGSKSSNIPGYASGQVIPPSMSAHLAVLGDNKQETEVVSPLSTIRQAVTEAMQNMGGTSGEQTIVINMDGREFMRVMVDRNREYKKQNGGVSAFA